MSASNILNQYAGMEVLDDGKQHLRIAMLDHITFVTALRDFVGSRAVLKGLLETSALEWDRSVNSNTGDHLIKDVAVGHSKSEAIQAYVAKVVKHYLVSAGTRATAWTKETISADNFTNVSITNRLAAQTFTDHVKLFRPVATRLIGFDDLIVDAATTEDMRVLTYTAMMYLANRFELASNRKELDAKYGHYHEYFETKFTENGFTPEYFVAEIKKAIKHYSEEPEEGAMHLMDRFDLLVQ